MKKISKVLAGLVSVIVVGSCIASVPTAADVVYNDLDVEISYPLKIFNPNTGKEDFDGITVYYLPEDFDIQDVINDENRTLVLNGQTFTLSCCHASNQVDPLEGSKTYSYENGNTPTIDEDYKVFSYGFKTIIEDNGNTWTVNWIYAINSDQLAYSADNIGMTKPTEDPTIGDSDQTIGDSKVTALRGDVNLDGDVNGLDLLYLKKYLLGLIEW